MSFDAGKQRMMISIARLLFCHLLSVASKLIICICIVEKVCFCNLQHFWFNGVFYITFCFSHLGFKIVFMAYHFGGFFFDLGYPVWAPLVIVNTIQSSSGCLVE